MTAAPGTVRIAMMATGFVALTLALIVLQPGPRRSGERMPQDMQQVARGAADLIEIPVAAVVAPQTAVAQPDPAPELPQPSLAQAGTDGTVAAETLTGDSADSIAATVANPPSRREAPPAALREMSWSILESLNAHAGRDVAPGEPGSLLHTIVSRAVEDAAALPDLELRRPGRAKPPTPEPVAGRDYIVQRDDTLMLIAQRVYGDAAQFARIFEANRDRMSSPQDLRIGQVLRLPPR